MRRHGQPAISHAFRTRVDAEAWARKLESEQERGVWHDSSEAERTTLHAALDRYEREKTPAKQSAVKEASVLRILRDEAIARHALARIGSADVAKCCATWQRAGLAPATIHRRLSVLSHVYEIAAREWGMAGLTNPVRMIKKPTVRNERSRRVTDLELEVICAASESRELESIIQLAVETAMRRSEICAMRWGHVDLGARTVHIQKTKNGYPRDIPLSTRAGQLLNALPRRIDGRVFSMRPDSVTQAFERAVARARTLHEKEYADDQEVSERNYLIDVRIHDLRHEATSRLAEKLEAHELAKVTGHRDLRMVLRYYHPRAEDLAQKLDQRWSPPGSAGEAVEV